VREQDDLPYRGHVGEQHHQPIDADALAGGRRQAVFERFRVVGVEVQGS
jgi:hypothetical protein